ncbi:MULTISPECIES: TetR/AcrR family transcriptional regulator [unclassified Curtobacterium]|uniref:TetR/AcrR family transcriptional regulator n=1 Tax=unclassified Curtobacterium TaxID=257496 RepID=UPI000DA8C5C3|nr:MULTISPECIES: TetR family transcriptional regulator C-terminal domain-containing protein [unclassified Curtobacterium]MDN3478519.1 TetR family transcriptional regulator C-terminal domain-containing protein [Curtobacterium sp. APC 4022]MDN4648690.1 TetR family transcriptional regulator C-terminal domain-containing protein [Curtobacterium sp. PsM8]WIE61931.1 TetR family transcriptional regulator C-terminal domain-containing protein [Curtobacterium sp. MCLR17_032]
MARSIDLEERRRTVSAAACQVLARDGLGALSVRNVAAEAGLPPSTVRYAFPTQASVREHAIASVFDRTRERIEAIPADLPTRQWARAVLVELLPLDDERVVELDVYLALGNAALTDAELRPTLDRVVVEMRRWCERVLEVLGVPSADLEYEACRLHALLDGLAMHVARLAPGESGDWAIDVLERHVDGVARA